MIKVMMVSSHAILSAGFRTIMADLDGFELAVYSALDHAREAAREQRPDILVIDVNSGMALDTVLEMMTAAPDSAVILWVDEVSVEFASQAVDRGVRGVLSKNEPIRIHQACLREVSEGRLWLDHKLSVKVLSAQRVRLTPRERQLTVLLTQGLKNKEIAYRLGITEGTVKVYLSRLYARCGASDRFEFALYALKNISNGQCSTAEPAARDQGALDPDQLPKYVNFERSTTRIH